MATATMMAGDNADEVTRLEGELATAETDRDANADEVTRLEGELAAAETDRDANADEVTRLEGELATAETDREANADEVTRLETDRDANADEVTRLEGELATAETERDELLADQVQNEPSAHKMAVVAGINDDTARPNTADAMIEVGAYGDREVSFNEFEAGEETAPDAGDPWTGSMLGATSDADADNPATADKVFVYTDRRAAEEADYQDYYGDDGPADGPGKTVVDNANDHSDTGDDRRVLTFQADISDEADLFMADAFPNAPLQTFTFEDVDDTTDVMENELPGSFQGVPGTYICTNPCSVATDDKGALSVLGGTWTFTPDEVAEDGVDHMVEAVTPDNTYVYFGYWLHVTDPDGEKEAIGVGTFARGSGPVTADTNGMRAIEGSASYSGSAGGKYAVKKLTSGGEINSLRTGQFVADVELNANFGGPTVVPRDAHQISGTIDNFRNYEDPDGNDNPIVEWEVSLGTASTDVDTDTNDDMINDNVGKTNGGMMGGTWTHVFHNRPVDDADTDEVDENLMAPGHVTGMFDAHFNDGHAIGAYGAVLD